MRQTKERILHHVTVSVFSKPYEQKEDVLKGLDALSPVPTAVLLQQKVEYDPERPRTTHYRMPDVALTVQVEDTDEGKMTIYTLFFRRMSSVNHFAYDLIEAMTPAEKQEFAESPEALLDYEGKLSVRLDKELLKQGKWSLTDDGNCYQIKAAVAAYPKNTEAILKVLEKLLT